MNTIELIEKLNELAQLVKIFENPRNFIESKLTKKAGWEYVKPKPIKQLGQAFTSGYYSQYNAKKELINTFYEDQAWQSDYIQAAFKAEVRKVAKVLGDASTKLNKKHWRTHQYHPTATLKLKEKTFEELFDEILKCHRNSCIFAYPYLEAICQKLGVELESEES